MNSTDSRLSPKWLPQVTAPKQYVLDNLNRMGISYREDVVKAKDCKPLQNMVDKNKADNFKKMIDEDQPIDSPYLSADNEILDGHHRVYAFNNHPEVEDIMGIKLHLGTPDAARVLNQIQDRYDFEQEAAAGSPQLVPFAAQPTQPVTISTEPASDEETKINMPTPAAPAPQVAGIPPQFSPDGTNTAVAPMTPEMMAQFAAMFRQMGGMAAPATPYDRPDIDMLGLGQNGVGSGTGIDQFNGDLAAQAQQAQQVQANAPAEGESEPEGPVDPETKAKLDAVTGRIPAPQPEAGEDEIEEMKVVSSNHDGEPVEPEANPAEDETIPEFTTQEEPNMVSFDTAGNNSKSLTLYKTKPLNTTSKSGDFLIQKKKDGFNFEYELEFDNLLEITDEDLEGFEYPMEAALKNWMPEATPETLKNNSKSAGLTYEVYLNRTVNTLAQRNNVDGVVYGTKFVQIINNVN